ncbi:DUF6318 family protein, partial [Buchananella hordeovulneris]
EIPEPILPPEAQAQAGFAEAELAAKYFVELQYYVAQTNDLATWEQVIHPESPSGKQVIENTHKRQADGVRLTYLNLDVHPVRAEQNVDRPEIYRVLLTLETEGEVAVNNRGETVDDNGARYLFIVSHVEYSNGTWKLIDSDFETEKPEEW